MERLLSMKVKNSLVRELHLSQTTIGGWLLGRTHTYLKHNIKSIEFINV